MCFCWSLWFWNVPNPQYPKKHIHLCIEWQNKSQSGKHTATVIMIIRILWGENWVDRMYMGHCLNVQFKWTIFMRFEWTGNRMHFASFSTDLELFWNNYFHNMWYTHIHYAHSNSLFLDFTIVSIMFFIVPFFVHSVSFRICYYGGDSYFQVHFLFQIFIRNSILPVLVLKEKMCCIHSGDCKIEQSKWDYLKDTYCVLTQMILYTKIRAG